MVTGGDEASFTGVYKLAARYYPDKNAMEPTMKFSDNPEKTTNPGIKNLWRIYDQDNMAKADILALDSEVIQEGQEKVFYHPSGDYRQFKFAPIKVELLLKKRIQQGRRLEEKRTPEEIIQKARETMKLQLGYFDNTYKRILNPHIYKVSMTEELRNLKNAFIQERLR